MDESDAIDALGRLGLSSYEAGVFVALQKLTVGTARDVARITDVPRSQVYGAAERLEERGLVEVRQSSPMQYRPVELEEARARLRRELERERERAFEFLEDVRGSHDEHDERQEAIWTVRGREAIDDRTNQLVRAAEEYVVYGFPAEFLDEELTDALLERAASGLDVTVVSADRAVVEAFADADVDAVAPPAEFAHEEWRGGRIFVADGDTVLLSALGAETFPDGQVEIAFWSSRTGFATALLQLVDGQFGSLVDL